MLCQPRSTDIYVAGMAAPIHPAPNVRLSSVMHAAKETAFMAKVAQAKDPVSQII